MKDILTMMNVAVDGYGFAGVAQKVTVPKIEVATQQFKASGTGPIDVRMGDIANTMTMTMEFGGLTPEIFGLIDPVEGATLPITCWGAAQDVGGAVHSHKIAAQGFVKVLDEGDWESGQLVPCKLEMSLRYYRRERDGQELVEYNSTGPRIKIKGRDVNAALRTAARLP